MLLRDGSLLTVRPMEVTDLAEVGRLLVTSLNEGAARQGFAPEFPSVAAATPVLSAYRRCSSTMSLVALKDGVLAAATFVHRRPGRGYGSIGPLVVEPSQQGGGAGAAFLAMIVEQLGSLPLAGLVPAWNTRMYAMVTRAGYVPMELLVRLQRPAAATTAIVDGRCRDGRVDEVDAIDVAVTGGQRVDDLRLVSGFGRLVMVDDGEDRGFLGVVRGTQTALLGPGAASSPGALARLLRGIEGQLGATHELTALLPASQIEVVDELRDRGWRVRDLFVTLGRGKVAMSSAQRVLTLFPESL
ncbi:MAG: hypothetical protein Q8O67_23640 [Deltaproteobacteria bacterium]|nr:hypothetical protein [Deltaproteobacteria bacterium]